MKFISTKIHGLLDYLVGLALIFAPYIFMFSEVGGMAVIIPQILGVGLILYSLFTDYELGVVRKLSMPYHLAIDIVASAFLALSPFIFSFYAGQPLNMWLPHVVVGITVILVVLFSKTVPEDKVATTTHS